MHMMYVDDMIAELKSVDILSVQIGNIVNALWYKPKKHNKRLQDSHLYQVGDINFVHYTQEIQQIAPKFSRLLHRRRHSCDISYCNIYSNFLCF